MKDKGPPLLLALEGGGTRSQAVLMDLNGRTLSSSQAGDVNINFVAFDQAQKAVRTAVREVLQSAGIAGENVAHFALALVGPHLASDTFHDLCPNAEYHYYDERAVVFARAGIYQPHGVGVVAATGATAWAVRADDGRDAACGGWGSLLGDEGSAYAAGLLALRAACRAYEGRESPTRLMDAICQHFGIRRQSFRAELIQLAYHKPLSRAEIGGLARVVSALAVAEDAVAKRIMNKVSQDLAALALFAARQVFTSSETFTVVAAGGLLEAGDMVIGPLKRSFSENYPNAMFLHGQECPAVALGKLALYHLGLSSTSPMSASR